MVKKKQKKKTQNSQKNKQTQKKQIVLATTPMTCIYLLHNCQYLTVVVVCSSKYYEFG